jgi:hypothetical protein
MAKTNRRDFLDVKTDRANQHIHDLDAAIHTFLHSHPYDVSIHNNTHTGRIEWTLDRAHDIPLLISALAGDAIQNLRSVLDHSVWQLVLANGQTPIDGVTGFPICDSAKEYASAKQRGKIKGVVQAAADAIDALKPYEAGNVKLWRLHRLNNIDKHRLLLSAASAVAHHDILPSQREELTRIYLGSHPGAVTIPDFTGVVMKPVNPVHARFPLEVGKVFFSIPKSDMQHDFKFSLGVAFNEPGIVERELVVDTLKHFADLVGHIISACAHLL